MILFKRFSTMFGVALLALFITGCQSTKEVVDSGKLETSVKMSETIFLEPVEPEQMTVWLKIRNTSDKADLDAMNIQKQIEARLTERGYKITRSPSNANYRLQANILYADHERTTMTEEAMLLGGVGGGLIGSTVGGDSTSRAGAVVAGVVLGSVLAGAAASDTSVDKYLLVVDISISEKSQQKVTGNQQGQTTAGTVQTTQQTGKDSDYLNYRTRIVGSAKKRNLNWEEARPHMVEGFITSLANIF